MNRLLRLECCGVGVMQHIDKFEKILCMALMAYQAATQCILCINSLVAENPLSRSVGANALGKTA